MMPRVSFSNWSVKQNTGGKDVEISESNTINKSQPHTQLILYQRWGWEALVALVEPPYSLAGQAVDQFPQLSWDR
jgi:hypothetical protein